MSDAQFIYGWHAVGKLLERNPGAIVGLRCAAGNDRRTADLLAAAGSAGVTVEKVSRGELERLYPGAVHQGVVAELRVSSQTQTDRQLPGFLASLAGPAFLLVLDGVQDPHNLGACLPGCFSGCVR